MVFSELDGCIRTRELSWVKNSRTLTKNRSKDYVAMSWTPTQKQRRHFLGMIDDR